MFDEAADDIEQNYHVWMTMRTWIEARGMSPSDFAQLCNLNEFVHFYRNEVHAVSDCVGKCPIKKRHDD